MVDIATTDDRQVDDPNDEELVDILHRMIDGQVYSTRCFNLQRQGRMGTMAPIDGSEAIAAGAASALDPATDWVFPQYREQYALGRFGDELVDKITLYNVGHPAGNSYPEDLHVFPFQISLACQIPHAVGMAWGMKVSGDPGCTLTFFGDGSSSEGDFYEAANLAGVRKAPVIFVLVNNGWAISTSTNQQTGAESFAAKAHAFGFPGVQVDGRDPLAVRQAVAEARLRAVGGQGPMLIEAVTVRHGPHTTADDPTKYMPTEEAAAAKREEPIGRFAAELTARGLWSPEQHAAAQQRAEERFDLAWERAQEATAALEPSAVFDHVYTSPTPRMVIQRQELTDHLAGRPTEPRVSAVGRTEPIDDPGPHPSSAPESRTMLETINLTLHEEMARDERVMVFGQDVGVNGGVFRATEGLVTAFGGDRVVDMPLAEAVIVGSTVGLAAAGMVPVAEIQFLGFSYQAMHQLVGQVARLRSRSGGRFDAPITIRAPFGGGVRTPELHSESLESQFANCPGLKIVAPSSAADAKGLLAAAIRDPDPVLFLEPLRGYRMVKDPVPEGDHLVEIGRSRLTRRGDDIVIVAWSYMVELANRAADALTAEGLSVGVLDLRSIVPLDIDGLARAVSAAGRAVVVQEAPETCGFASEVIATANDHCFYDLEAPIARVSGFDVPYPVGQLEDFYVPDVDRITAAVRRTLEVAP